MKSLEELKAELKELEEKKKEISPYVAQYDDILKRIRTLSKDIKEYDYEYARYQAKEKEKNFKIEIASFLSEGTNNKEYYEREENDFLIGYRLEKEFNCLKFLIADTRNDMNLFSYELLFGNARFAKEKLFEIMQKYNVCYLFIHNRSYYDVYGQRHIWVEFEYKENED